MDNDLAFREYRVSFKGVALLAVACAGVYAGIAAYGELALGALAFGTVGAIAARCIKF